MSWVRSIWGRYRSLGGVSTRGGLRAFVVGVGRVARGWGCCACLRLVSVRLERFFGGGGDMPGCWGNLVVEWDGALKVPVFLVSEMRGT